MAVGIGASSVLGVAFETTSGTYVAPTKFIPYLSESLKFQQATTWRRPIRNASGVVGAIAGDSHIEGDIEIEGIPNNILYFLRVMRTAMNKTGASAPFTYTFTPTSAAVPTKTMSITVVRNGVTFGYVGCIVGSAKFSWSNGALTCTFSVVGADEASQSLPTATFTTDQPFGAGQHNLQIPTASQIFDADSAEITIEDNATPQYRLSSAGTNAQYISFGESDINFKIDRDFQARTEYDLFKAETSQSITFTSSQGANASIAFLMPASIIDTYEVNVGGQGDLIRATVNYKGVLDGTGKHYQITLICTDTIT